MADERDLENEVANLSQRRAQLESAQQEHGAAGGEAEQPRQPTRVVYTQWCLDKYGGDPYTLED